VSDFNKHYKKILENFESITYRKRLFYPRNFKLSEEFVKAFRTELKRLADEGHSPKLILDKIAKALVFHSRK